MDVNIEPNWKLILSDTFSKDYFQNLASFVKEEYGSKKVFPPAKDIFNAFWKCPYDEVKVVVIGQDPYHGESQAHGLSFSVLPGVRFPPSLLNIFKEIKSDLGKEIPPNGDLTRWAKQGVFLLNATLTVRAHEAGSHQKKGWEEFTDHVIKEIAEKKEGLVFMLWGAYAQKKEILIPSGKHLVLKAPHPSPLSAHRGFLGCRHFSKANAYLESKGESGIDW